MGDNFIRNLNDKFNAENETIRIIAYKWSNSYKYSVDFINFWFKSKEEY